MPPAAMSRGRKAGPGLRDEADRGGCPRSLRGCFYPLPRAGIETTDERAGGGVVYARAIYEGPVLTRAVPGGAGQEIRPDRRM